MKIATMVRGYMPVPRPHDILYAPIDLAVEVAKGLHAKGHTVHFYAPQGSRLPMPVKTLGIPPLITNEKEWEAHLSHIKPHIHYVPWLKDFPFVRRMFEQADKGEYDALLFHHPEIALPFIEQYPEVVTASVLHDPLYDWYADMCDRYRSPHSRLVSISDHQRAPRPDLPFAGTIYNGVDVAAFPYSEAPGEYLLFCGRIVPEKGAAEAVRVARLTGQKLIIAGLLFPQQQAYFDEHIKPYLNQKIQYVGYIDRDKLAPYYQRASALLMPIGWDEPFGRTMTEAMATGTPVIAFRRGSVPEVIADGETGFIVDTVEDMAEAVTKVPSIDRQACRRRVETLFSIETMIDSYERLLTQLVDARAS